MNPTAEELQQHISAAFDSVSLINGIVAGDVTFEDTAKKKDCLQRNTGHLKVMNGHDWFVTGLTTQQATDISASIAAGDALAATL